MQNSNSNLKSKVDQKKIFKIEKTVRKETLRKYMNGDEMNIAKTQIQNMINNLTSLWEKIKLNSKSNNSLGYNKDINFKTNRVATKNVFNLDLNLGFFHQHYSSEFKADIDNMSVIPVEDFYDYQYEVMRDQREQPRLNLRAEDSENEKLNFDNSNLFSELLLSRNDHNSNFLNNISQTKGASEEEQILTTNYYSFLNHERKDDSIPNKVCKSKRSTRSKYKMYSPQAKIECLQLLNEYTPEEVVYLTGVPTKSLKRWIAVGPVRKKGCGRKVRDVEMEDKVIKWYNLMKEKDRPITPCMMKNKALKLRSADLMDKFLASNGWLEKLKKKYNLKLSYRNKRENRVEVKNENS